MERELCKPGYFSIAAAADSRRSEFDIKNETVIRSGVPVRAVFIGDSITHNFEVQAFFKGDPETGIILNRGIGGDKPEYILKRIYADAVQLEPEWIILLCGINDIWALDERPATAESTAGYLEEKIVSGVIRIAESLICLGGPEGKSTDIKMILCSLLPTGIPEHIPGHFNNGARNRLIAKINGRLKAYADGNGVFYADYHSAMTKEDGLTMKEGISDDGIHPNGFGYRIMAETLRRFIP